MRTIIGTGKRADGTQGRAKMAVQEIDMIATYVCIHILELIYMTWGIV